MSASVYQIRKGPVPPRCVFCGAFVQTKFKRKGTLRLHGKWICSACSLIIEYFYDCGEKHPALED